MDETLPGRLIHIFLVSILDAALLSWIALRLYRRGVRRLMLARLAAADPAIEVREAVPGAAPPDARTLVLQPVLQTGSGGAPSRPLPGGRLARAYGAGALAYAAVITVLTLAPASPPLPLGGWIAYLWVQAWPVVPALAILMVLDRAGSLRLLAWYLAAGAVLVAGSTLGSQVLRGSLNSAPATNVFWMLALLVWSASAPLLLLLITAGRRVRAVMPLALAVTLLFGFATMLSAETVVRTFDIPAISRAVMNVAAIASAEAALFAPLLLVSLPVGWLAWRLIRWLARAFERKRFSDVQLVVDCWWAVVTAERIATTLVALHGPWSLLGGVAAFAAYRTSVALALRGGDRIERATPRRLLLLRVFGYEARTEALFDRVAQRWRFHGPVQLIAGVDLAMRTADPGDLLAFLNGRLADNFVRTPADVAPRLDRLDLGRDPDSRFRVNELYCATDTWQATLQALLDVTDTVLMDLRSFHAGNAGCIFELEQLLRKLPTDEIVLVCDRTTDLPLLQRVMGEAWAQALGEGVARGSGTIPLVRVDRQSRREFTTLMDLLLERAMSRPATPAAGPSAAPA